MGADSFLQKMDFVLSKSQGLANGEIIQIEIKMDDMDKAVFDERFSTSIMDYTVETGDDYWIMADTEIDEGKLAKLSDLAEAQLRSSLADGIQAYEWTDKLQEITGYENDDVFGIGRVTVDIADIQLAVVYMGGTTTGNRKEHDLTEYDNRSYSELDDDVGIAYCIFKTNGNYCDGDGVEMGEAEVIYVVPIIARCDTEDIPEFYFYGSYTSIWGLFSSLEDAEFALYRDCKITQKLEP